MTANTMMEKIAKTLTKDERVTVMVAHKGAWGGAHVYEITSEGFTYVKHVWGACGTLRDEYKNRVLKTR